MSSTSRQKPAAKKSPPKKAARPDGGRAAPATRSAGAAAAAAPAPALAATPRADPGKNQTELFDRAIALFHARKYAEARELFKTASAGPNRGMAHSARLHERICERRISKAQINIRTPEERYNYAIALMNERRLPDAEDQLRRAIAQAPSADHLYYALALCLALRGDVQGARANLKQAIDIDPRNRVAARNDPDFAEFAQLSPIAELLYPEGTGA